jgi:hypothetical protein
MDPLKPLGGVIRWEPVRRLLCKDTSSDRQHIQDIQVHNRTVIDGARQLTEFGLESY